VTAFRRIGSGGGGGPTIVQAAQSVPMLAGQAVSASPNGALVEFAANRRYRVDLSWGPVAGLLLLAGNDNGPASSTARLRYSLDGGGSFADFSPTVAIDGMVAAGTVNTGWFAVPEAALHDVWLSLFVLGGNGSSLAFSSIALELSANAGLLS